MARRKPLSLNDSDTLVLFGLRLQELKQKKYYRLYSFEALRQCQRTTDPVPDLVEEEYLISYLALVRQFFLKSEPISRENVHRVLTVLADRTGDIHLKHHLARLTDDFESVSIQLHRPVRNRQCETDYTDIELFNLFFHNHYFHTDADYFNFHATESAVGVLNARIALEVFTHRFVELLKGYENLANHVLLRGLLPQGKLKFRMVQDPEGKVHRMEILPETAL